MNLKPDTTIAAPATGTGGALAVIRVSGPETFRLISELFITVSGADLREARGYTVHYGQVKEEDEFIDDAVVTLYRAPASYSGEDAAEISFHASPWIAQKIMKMLLARGATAAMPGEFTMRAFMNGKMDLSQAEAVADIIVADSSAAHRLAASQLRGGLSEEIEKLRQELLQFASLIELELDFSEEDVQFADRFSMSETVINIKSLVERLASSFRLGNAIKKGIPVVIAGRPNVGKSSLLNLLLQEERAIVSEIPGTTRDTVEEVLHVGGLLFRFIDTAGLRQSDDEIELLGVERTMRKLEAAEVVLAVAEATDTSGELAAFAASVAEMTGNRNIRIILVVNKTDLIEQDRAETLKKELAGGGELPVVAVSAKEATGIDELREMLLKSVETGALESPQYIVTNARHYEALTNVSENLQRVLDGFRDGIPTVLIATDVRQAIYYLGLITGRITPDDILGEIFSRFCIGK
ncbi:MAG: tRNA uridine-5-carboxymethylaminomethyl(34) synthesis GTPase MnmE [Bacteroidales bacterium]|nr:tRNA uridine-5-carboxymethylaminomethyl(34) synthesis GTPase MnmE [Bacteroidales bacterium]MDT8372962.1 tRNA uridine-5-carboxymethylaminomethyl(34) synthesis GTPase MnmE [Bacteroidales bacterium]